MVNYSVKYYNTVYKLIAKVLSIANDEESVASSNESDEKENDNKISKMKRDTYSSMSLNENNKKKSTKPISHNSRINSVTISKTSLSSKFETFLFKII
jgi:hypothetical protein